MNLNRSELQTHQQQALAAVTAATNQQSLENIRIKYLGRQGIYSQLLKELAKINPAERASLGKLLNDNKTVLIQALSEAEIKISRLENNRDETAWVDMTTPVSRPTGSLHLITQAIQDVVTIFSKIGFNRVSYPEMDYDWYAFESLNMPKKHPARDEWETFFVDLPAHPRFGEVVLTPHTSNGQVREMERLKEPPVRMINIARCYRRQSDLTHTPVFHQFEGLMIDKGISIPDLKGVIGHFAREYYGADVKIRLRPFQFKFTEPSFEIDFSCVHCQGKGCRFCKSGWHEVAGSGMVHPNVLKNGGIDPKKYTGFAFGWGVERMLSLKPGLGIDDIRTLYSNDLRFLRQF